MKQSIYSFLKFVFAGFSIAAIMVAANLALAVPVNINSADADTIADALKGVGPKTAEKIVDYRNKNGDYKAVEDLLNINGIGAKKLARFKVDVRLEGGLEGTAKGANKSNKAAQAKKK